MGAHSRRMLRRVAQVAARAGQAALPPAGGAGRRFAPGVAGVLLGTAAVGYGLWHSLYTVDGGHRAVMYNKLVGVKPVVIPEGTHIRVPW